MRLLSYLVGGANLVMYGGGMFMLVADSAPDGLVIGLVTIFFIAIAQQFVFRHERACLKQSSPAIESKDRQAE